MNELSGQKIGVIGLGLMGRPMAENLQTSGANVIVHNRSQGVIQELVQTGMMTTAATPAEMLKKTDVVILMLPDTAVVENIVYGENGLMDAATNGQLIIDMGTTRTDVTRKIGHDFRARQVDFIDAPVSGGKIGAEKATLTIMAGGTDAAIKRAAAIFAVLGSRLTHVGENGAGQIAKAANQVIVGLTIGAVAEALTLAKKAGADPEKVKHALKGGFADSPILDIHGGRMIDGTFTPGGKCTTQRKDMDQALILAEQVGIELPATALSRDLYDKVIEAGHGDLDHAALVLAIDEGNK